MKTIATTFLIILQLSCFCVFGQIPNVERINHVHYPKVMVEKPSLPSPFIHGSNEYVIAFTKKQKYAIIDVTLSNDRGICQQLIVDTLDFPELARTGLHDSRNILKTASITGWSVDTISRLGQPGELSSGGFLAEGEDVISVISNDNAIVSQLGFLHHEMAKPIFHVLNMMDIDLQLNRWNMVKHEWEHIQYFYYNGKKVSVIAYDTKGGQKSIFNDGLGGAFHVRLWREVSEEENHYLLQQYSNLSQTEYERMIQLLSILNVGEMQPQYIMRYGFYEGHTYWRAEPIAIAFIFGMLNLEELDQKLGNDLYGRLTNQFTQ